jgi:hypothetical protein
VKAEESDEQNTHKRNSRELSVSITPNTAEYIPEHFQSDGEKEGINDYDLLQSKIF